MSTSIHIEPHANDIELSIVMPCLDEAETLGACIGKALDFLKQHHIRGEVVVGDNGSTDGSREIALQCGARVVEAPIRGYGAAIYFATRAARGRYIIMGDSDDSYDFSALEPFVRKLREGFDLVMGNRFVGGVRPGAMPWKNRYVGNPILSAIGRLFFRSPARDFHCGLRGYSREAFDRLDLRTTGMEFASEMVIKATLLKMRIAEVPTTLDRAGRSRPPHLRPWRDGWRHLRFMLLYSPRWLFLYPGVLLALLGLGAMILLLPGDFAVGGVHLGVHTLVYCTAFVAVGYQSILFSTFTKIFAISEGLLPDDPRLTKLFEWITLEWGLLAGLGLIVLGLAGSVYAVAFWAHHQFGPLDAARVLRLVAPSSLCLLLGFQTIFASLFLSVLGLRIRRLLNKGDTTL